MDDKQTVNKRTNYGNIGYGSNSDMVNGQNQIPSQQMYGEQKQIGAFEQVMGEGRPEKPLASYDNIDKRLWQLPERQPPETRPPVEDFKERKDLLRKLIEYRDLILGKKRPVRPRPGYPFSPKPDIPFLYPRPLRPPFEPLPPGKPARPGYPLPMRPVNPNHPVAPRPPVAPEAPEAPVAPTPPGKPVRPGYPYRPSPGFPMRPRPGYPFRPQPKPFYPFLRPRPPIGGKIAMPVQADYLSNILNTMTPTIADFYRRQEGEEA